MVKLRSQLYKHNRLDEVIAVEMAVVAIEDRPNPLDDPELIAADPAPRSPNLPDGHLAHEFRFESNGTGDSRNACIYAAVQHVPAIRSHRGPF